MSNQLKSLYFYKKVAEGYYTWQPLMHFTSNLSNSTLTSHSNHLNLYLTDMPDRDAGYEQILPSFQFLRSSTVVAFFMSQRVDIPLCFQRSKSLHAPVFGMPLLKFTNLLMRHGDRCRVMRTLTRSFHEVTFFSNWDRWGGVVNWVEVSALFATTTPSSAMGFIKNPDEVVVDDDDDDDEVYLPLAREDFIETLKNYLPLFSFYIRKVDKSVRKHSRGKSGKYSLMWRYVPKYKRLLTTLRWFLREIRFQKGRSFEERLTRALMSFLNNPSASYVGQLRLFVHRFVFKHHRQTLLETLRSTSR